jgi:hypothetical protein
MQLQQETASQTDVAPHILLHTLQELLDNLRQAVSGQAGDTGMREGQPDGQEDDQQPAGAAAQQAGGPAPQTPWQQQQQQWAWPPAADADDTQQQAEWDAAAHGSTYRCVIIGQDFDKSGPAFLDSCADVGKKIIEWQQQEKTWPQMPDSSSGDPAILQGFNSYAEHLLGLGPVFTGLLLNLHVQMQQMQQTLHGVQTSVHHLGMGVNTVVQQQQQLSGQQQLTVELQHKALHGIDGLMASNVALHQTVQGLQQQVNTLQQDVTAVATAQAQGSAGSKAGQPSKAQQRKKNPAVVPASRADSSSATAAAAAAAAGQGNAADATEQVMYQRWPGAAPTLKGMHVAGLIVCSMHQQCSNRLQARCAV